MVGPESSGVGRQIILILSNLQYIMHTIFSFSDTAGANAGVPTDETFNITYLENSYHLLDKSFLYSC